MPENNVQRVEQVKVVVAEIMSRVCLITALTVCERNYALNTQLAGQWLRRNLCVVCFCAISGKRGIMQQPRKFVP